MKKMTIEDNSEIKAIARLLFEENCHYIEHLVFFLALLGVRYEYAEDMQDRRKRPT